MEFPRGTAMSEPHGHRRRHAGRGDCSSDGSEYDDTTDGSGGETVDGSGGDTDETGPFEYHAYPDGLPRVFTAAVHYEAPSRPARRRRSSERKEER